MRSRKRSVLETVKRFTGTNSKLRSLLDKLYSEVNRRDYVSPDPLEFLYKYPDARDIEIVGLVASSLAFGNVRQILKSVSKVLHEMKSPRDFLDSTDESDFPKIFTSFRHRFVSGKELASLLRSAKFAIRDHGSLAACFKSCIRKDDETVLPALQKFVERLNFYNGDRPLDYLLPLPSRGSACKRLNLYLRWMVRKDDVDPGIWKEVPARKLLIPLDTHMWQIAQRLHFTARKQADMKSVIEITDSFRKINPEDPVKYDFALTRAGIRRNIPGPPDLAEILDSH